MKKKFMFAFIAAFAMVAGYNVYKSQSVMDGMSEFALANVEALAQTENDVIRCVSVTGSTLFYCKRNYMLKCYCDGAKPGDGWERTNNPYN